MLAFIIFILLFVGGIFAAKYFDRKWNETLAVLCVFVAVLASFCILIFGGIGLSNVFTEDAKAAELEQIYKSLTYQLENDIYDNDNDLGKKELYDAITVWNEDIASSKIMQDNIWVGMLWKDIYDDFELIELG